MKKTGILIFCLVLFIGPLFYLLRGNILQTQVSAAPKETIEKWQAHAIPPHRGTIRELEMQPNVASRAKIIVYRLLELGETLAWLYNKLFSENINSESVIGLDRNSLEYYGWWKPELIEPITYHIPIDMTRESFLSRCGKLEKYIVQSIKEALLRRIVERLPVEKSDIEEHRSLGLLKILVQHSLIANNSGLVIFNNGVEIESRRKAEKIDTTVTELENLRKLRQDDAHISHNYKNCIKRLGFSSSSVEAGHGLVMDRLYDKLGLALFEIAKSLNITLKSYESEE